MRDIRRLIIDMSDNLAQKMTKLDQSLGARVQTIEKKVTVLNTKWEMATENLNGVKESIEFTNNKLQDLEKSLPDGETIERLLERVKVLEDQAKYQEWRSRKYNLLIYGVEETPQEDTEATVRKLCVSTLKLSTDYADSINIVNCHRIPRNPNATYNAGAPNAIMVKLCNFKDRGTILSASRNIDRETRITVRTDLPKEWKRQRAELATVAYNMRKDKHYQTAIRETARGVSLEYRAKKDDPWQRYT